MSAEHNRVRAGELLDQLARFDDLLRVEAGGRLVENQNFRIVKNRLREPDALPVTLRELPAVTIRHVVDASASHGVFDAASSFARGHPLDLDPRDELKVLAHRHLRVERRRLREVSGPALGFDRLLEDVESGDDRLALSRRHVAGQDAHGRRLAGAVWSEEPEDLSALDAEGQVVDRSDAAVAFGEVLNLNQWAISITM